MIGPTSRKKWFIFGIVIRSRIRITHHFSTSFTIAKYEILADILLAFLIQSPADFHDTRRTDWRQQDNESTAFWDTDLIHNDKKL